MNNQICAGVPIQSRSKAVGIVGLISGPLAVIAVILRCFSRYSTTRRLAADDWLAVAVGLLVIVLTVLDVYSTSNF